MVDEGDLVILRGPFGKEDRIAIETWRLRDGEWQRAHREKTYAATTRLSRTRQSGRRLHTPPTFLMNACLPSRPEGSRGFQSRRESAF